MSIYTKEYFIAKFEAIPTLDIGASTIHNHCALYHCGVRDTNGHGYIVTEEAVALNTLLEPLIDQSGIVNYSDANIANVWRVNDASTNLRESVHKALVGIQPRERMLTALQMLP